MKEFYIGQLRTDDEIQDYFMVKAIAIKIGSNKKQYLDMILCDKTGDLTAKKWDVADAELPALNEISAGDIVKLKGNVTEWNGMRQLRVLKLRKTVPEDSVELMDFIKSAPEKAENMYQFIVDKAGEIGDEGLRKLCLRVLADNEEKLMYYPAAAKNHHAELAGLLYHMKRMLMTAERICEVYLNLNKDLVTAGVIVHDIEKLNEIDADTMGIASGYSFEGQLLGHLVQGIKSIDRLAVELGVGEEKKIMLEHMILSHHYEPDFGSPKKPLFPEAEILHYLDIIDARMYDMEEALDATSPGEFSDKVWTLDNRRLYKPQTF
ncbi:MAG TPA: HD domain-containing protein [Anaerovoracaceae bacterium]|nr:HD domain-containing protein [Anaerovoracaceae bacterium]